MLCLSGAQKQDLGTTGPRHIKPFLGLSGEHCPYQAGMSVLRTTAAIHSQTPPTTAIEKS